MGNVLISFVIPMYNKEDYIRETINSIMNSCLINQFESYEIIVVDDESTDNSYESIKDYIASNDIKYYKQVNQGPSAARNNGLNKASGVYVIFVDADDIILPKYISFIKYAAEQEIKKPVIAVNYSEENNPSYDHFLKNSDSSEIAFDHIYYIKDLFNAWSVHQFFYTTSVCISRNFLINNKIQFPEGYNSGEDQFVWFELGKLTGVLFLDQVGVIYRKGVVNQLSSKLPLDVEIHVKKLLQIERCTFFTNNSVTQLIDKNYTYIIVNNFLSRNRIQGLRLLCERKRIFLRKKSLIKLVLAFVVPSIYRSFKGKKNV